MQISDITPRRRLRSYREVTKHVKWQPRHRRRTLGEENGDKTAVTDVQYHVTVLPKDASQNEKNDRLAELADIITNIKESDVFVISMWIG
jgi:hypothetical protein